MSWVLSDPETSSSFPKALSSLHLSMQLIFPRISVCSVLRQRAAILLTCVHDYRAFLADARPRGPIVALL